MVNTFFLLLLLLRFFLIFLLFFHFTLIPISFASCTSLVGRYLPIMDREWTGFASGLNRSGLSPHGFVLIKYWFCTGF